VSNKNYFIRTKNLFHKEIFFWKNACFVWLIVSMKKSIKQYYSKILKISSKYMLN
jgi:hypothetical protein